MSFKILYIVHLKYFLGVFFISNKGYIYLLQNLKNQELQIFYNKPHEKTRHKLSFLLVHK